MANKNRFIDTGDARPFHVVQNYEDEVNYSIDFSREATRRGTTVSSVAWSHIAGNSVTIDNTALASNVASADIKGSYRGKSKVAATAAFADGNKRKRIIVVTILDASIEQTYE